MCGIFGFHLSRPGEASPEEVLRRMGDAIRHRGPDDDGMLVDGGFGFGMRRLSIIDLKTGRQPISNEDGNLHVVFNGEIYNYRELAQQLLARGHTLHTTSDTEVIVHLYEDYGPECVHHLRGMFAIALWDATTRTLFLARDRLGIKPLYYSVGSFGLVFASELKAVLQCPHPPRDLDTHALFAYLRYGYVPDPLSILRGVSKLPPGHFLLARDGAPVRLIRYWDPGDFFAAPPRHVPEPQLRDALRRHLEESVRLHLVSDVPLGAFLSGGIDSTTVVALMAAELGRSIKTFSIGFTEEAFNEAPYARLAAGRLGTEHHELIVEPTSVDLIERLVGYFDEPFADASAIPTYLVSMLAREHVKVVLSGDGGDELFAGYDRYVVDHHRRGYDVLSRIGAAATLRWASKALPEGSTGKNYLYNVSLPRMERYLDGLSHFPPRLIDRLLSPDLLAEFRGFDTDVFEAHVVAARRLDFPARLQYLDHKTYLPGDILTKLDRMSMAHSIEARVPLLDHKLVEFAAGIPSRHKLRAGETKYLFKQAVQDLVPADILRRSKQGFAVPLERWFRKGFQTFLRERLCGGEALRHGLFNRAYVESLFDLYVRTAKGVYLDRLWTLLVFEIWYRANARGAP